MIKLRNHLAYRMFASSTAALGAWTICFVVTAYWSGPAPSSVRTITHPASISDATDQTARTRIQDAYGQLPLTFERNDGQTDPNVRFLSRGSGYNLFLTSSEAVLALRKPYPEQFFKESKETIGNLKFADTQPTVLRMKLAGSSPAKVRGAEEVQARSNYLLGNDPKRWHTNIPRYARIQYESVYPGIDLVYYGTNRQLEFDFVVAPGADPDRIRLRFEGTCAPRIDGNGDLVLDVEGAKILQHKPMVYQEVSGVRHVIPGGYVKTHDDEISFQIASYDASLPLVIDPVLVYSTYIGGNSDDFGNSIAVDGEGQAYVAGRTFSLDFPTLAGTVQQSAPPVVMPGDAFVVKLNRWGTALVYSTYLGGEQFDEGLAIAVDSGGNAYVAGRTFSPDFPTTPSAFHPGPYDFGNAFVSKLDPTGATLVYSTYLGGNADDQANGIAVDGSGQAFVTGETLSTDFPTTPGAFQPFRASLGDAFVTKLNRRGTALVYSTYLGGGGSQLGFDAGLAIAVDPTGHAYVTGRTESVDFPTTPAALQPAHAGGVVDAFVTKLNRRGTALVYSTFLGGTGFDPGATGIALDPFGSAYVTGRTFSNDFPTTPGALQSTKAGTSDGFVAKLNRRGTALVYSTYLGGTGITDEPTAIAVDSAGHAYVTGRTSSPDFPTTSNALQPALLPGFTDVFITKLNGRGSGLAYSTFLGGSFDDWGLGIAVDGARNIYVTGFTLSSYSNSFPITPGALQSTNGAGAAFIAKIGTPD